MKITNIVWDIDQSNNSYWDKDDVEEFIDVTDMVKTNIGYIPKADYLDIIARQSGFDDYDDMLKAGYHIGSEECV